MSHGTAARLTLAAAGGVVIGISVIFGLEQAEAYGIGWMILVGFVLFLLPGILAVLLSAPEFEIRHGGMYGVVAAVSPLVVGTAYALAQEGLAGPIAALASVLFIVTAGLAGGAAGAMAVAVVGALRDARAVQAGAGKG